MNYIINIIIVVPLFLYLIVNIKFNLLLKNEYPDFWSRNKYLRFGINGFKFLSETKNNEKIQNHHKKLIPYVRYLKIYYYSFFIVLIGYVIYLSFK